MYDTGPQISNVHTLYVRGGLVSCTILAEPIAINISLHADMPAALRFHSRRRSIPIRWDESHQSIAFIDLPVVSCQCRCVQANRCMLVLQAPSTTAIPDYRVSGRRSSEAKVMYCRSA
jgi:hypothetical protein